MLYGFISSLELKGDMNIIEQMKDTNDARYIKAAIKYFLFMI